MSAGRVDANVILRHLTGEPAAQAERAHHFFQAAERGDAAVFLEDVILAEVVCTLTSFYRTPRSEIARALLALLALDQVAANDKDALRLALIIFSERNVDFADALLAAKALRSGDPLIISFDRDFDRIPGIRRREP